MVAEPVLENALDVDLARVQGTSTQSTAADALRLIQRVPVPHQVRVLQYRSDVVVLCVSESAGLLARGHSHSSAATRARSHYRGCRLNGIVAHLREVATFGLLHEVRG